MIEEIQRRVNADQALQHRGRWVNLTFVFGIGDDDYLITISAGKITDIRQRHLPTDTGIFAMLPKQIARIDGELLPLMQNLQYFKDIIAKLRDGKGDENGG